ncbi:TetR/AcrR family transcriptional regulator [Chelativorans sp. AA-79]|uniref:TetR/AcrR family transcriptional regulator n=1 Tax=Chelativorans sp. AA-79 TaxID=3028735 RepID=UPI0023F98959|nr:TetR/AcrR family transcriptional regulator [Chelativorans sp. AA-79]WEX10463.1 TetR/AcrR family transcriptional regulator [Chelativorans sp. AA-79]
MASGRNTRQKILKAATELAKMEGSAHLSLDAVAARAGISKGGLLYNFPTKSALLKALVQQYIDDFQAALDERTKTGGRTLVAEYFAVAVEELHKKTPPPSGILAAMAEDPDLLAPIRTFSRDILDRMKSETDEASVLLTFLVLEGLRCERMFGTDVLHKAECEIVLERLRAMLEQTGGR